MDWHYLGTTMNLRLIVLAISLAFYASATIITTKHENGTTTVYAEDGLQTAIDDSVCGDIIEIEPGAGRHYAYPYLLRGPVIPVEIGGPSSPPSYARDCASVGKFRIIRSSLAYQLTPGKRIGAEDAAYLAFVGGIPLTVGLSCTMFQTEPGANNWILQGLELVPSATDCSGGGHTLITISNVTYTGTEGLARLDQSPHHITVDQCWLHGIPGYPVRDGILPDGRMVTISNSTIEDFRVGQIPDATNESHAIIMERAGPVRILNNKLSGQAMVVISGGTIISTRRGPEYVEMKGNWLYKPYKLLDWFGTIDPTPSSPCPVDADGHGATYKNTVSNDRFECQGAAPGTWTSISSGTHDALVAARVSGGYQKNVMEFKRMTNLQMEGNILDSSAPFTFDNQLGTCMLLSLVDGPSGKDLNIRFENNICRHAGWGFRTSSDLSFLNPDNHTSFWDNSGRALHNIVVRNNYYHHMGETMYTNPGFGHVCFDAAPAGNSGGFTCSSGFVTLVTDIADAVTVDHNTFESRIAGNTVSVNNYVYNNGMRLDRPYLTGGRDSINQRVTNNLMTAGLRTIAGGSGGNDNNGVSSLWGPHAAIAANGFIDYLGLGTNYGGGYNPVDGMIYHCTATTLGCPYTGAFTSYPPNCLGNGKTMIQTGTTAAGSCLYDAPANLGFTSYPDDLTLQSGSPFKAAGLDGKDLGADLNTVGWATANVEAGTMSPYLAMKIRLIRPASTSAFVRFSAPDTSSCTVEARVYGRPLSTPVATTTVNTSNLDRTATLTGLSTAAHYGLKVTCAGSYYRESDFRTL
jgi:hypothetical protein